MDVEPPHPFSLNDSEKKQVAVCEVDAAGDDKDKNHFSPMQNSQQPESNPTASMSVTGLVLHPRIHFVRKGKTVYSSLLSKKATDWLYKNVWRNKRVLYMNIITWMALYGCAIATAFNRNAIPFTIYSIVQIPYYLYFICYQLAFVNMDVAKHLKQSFNFWYVICHAVVCTVSIFLLWEFEPSPMLAAVHCGVTMVCFILLDSYPAQKKGGHSFSSLNGFLSLLILYVSMKLIPDMDYRPDTIIYYGDVHIIDMKSQATDSLLVVMIYFTRILYFKFFRRSLSLIFLQDSFHYEDRKMRQPKAHQQNTFFSFLKSIKRVYQRVVEVVFKKNAITVVESYSAKPSTKVEGKPQIWDPIEIQSVMCSPADYLAVGIFSRKFIQVNEKENLLFLYARTKAPIVFYAIRSIYFIIFSTLLSVFSAYMSLWRIGEFNQSTSATNFSDYVCVMTICIVWMHIIFNANLMLSRKIIKTFDYWYVTCLSLQMVISAGLLCGWDLSLSGWVLVFSFLQWFMMLDAFPRRFHRMNWAAIFGIIWSLAAGLMCKLGIGSSLSKDVVVTFSGLQIISARSNLSGSLFSISLFMSRFLYTYWKNAQRSIFIQWRWETRSVSQLCEEGFFSNSKEDHPPADI